MSASVLKAKSVKFAGDSDDESETVEDQAPEEEYDEDSSSDTDDEDVDPEERDNEEEYDEYDLDIATGVDLTRDDEPADIGIMSELETHDDEESMLISNDSLNIHTSPYLTKYELTKVLALRAQQILTSAPPTVPASAFPDNTYPVDPYTIALMELKMSRLPLIIGRRLPNNTIIRIPVHALLIPE